MRTIAEPTFSVIVCAYTERRWQDLCESVQSVLEQTLPPIQLLVVVDHNDVLLQKARQRFGALKPDHMAISVVANAHLPGLSGARNTGIEAAHGEVLAFLDDDATADPRWLESMVAHYSDDHVMGVGGSAQPLWPVGVRRPATLPAPRGGERGELDWVIGCTYEGLPADAATVRNLMGCNMSMRAEVFGQVGMFSEDLGRIGRTPLGCEETEMCIRIAQSVPDSSFVFEPRARAAHRVSPDRLTWSYLFSRCYAEGVSKAAVSRMVGQDAALASERRYVAAVLPRAVLRELFNVSPRHLLGAGAILAGTATTVAGYVRGKAANYTPTTTRPAPADTAVPAA
ncbi:glycosyltransferase [Allobranchiibius huperziae]|uniref:Glycosyltransferase involved in cell wall biosynthesis n=1 Tax=Allobranchiibius huperziae TaxID=1874116 RepID=A0A853DHJ0_9MICO|nr:glycosyltransferase involved in cell wall biosynthesis [Allobranchiibius huperziae]